MPRRSSRLKQVASFVTLAAVAAIPATALAALTDAQKALIEQAAAECPGLSSGAGPNSFYWEVGDGTRVLDSGNVGLTNVSPTDSTFPLASGSKLIFSTFMKQTRPNGLLTDEDTKYLRMYGGYSKTATCLGPDSGPFVVSVLDCYNQTGGDKAYDSTNDGKFYYSGAQFQAKAVKDTALGLLGLNATGLANKIALTLPILNGKLTYKVPSIGGGGQMAPADYGAFLRWLIVQSNQSGSTLANLLGSSAVCTVSEKNASNLEACPTAGSAGLGETNSPPLPGNQVWQYSLGHFVEKDPVTGAGDGAYSSPGEFGFYPWIDSTKTYYGIVARVVYFPTAYQGSILCGQHIRDAFTRAIATP